MTNDLPDRTRQIDRRTLLELTGASGIGAFAGCLSSDDGGSDDDTENGTDDEDTEPDGGENQEEDENEEEDEADPTEELDPIGNWPPEGDEVVFGFNGPLSGALVLDGREQEKGFDLAVDHLNEGGGLVDRYDGLSSDGVLGYEVESTTADTTGDPDWAADNLEAMIEYDNIQFCTGGVSGAASIEAQDVAQREKVPYVASNSTRASLSGLNCSRYYFHPGIHAETIGMAAGELLPEALGEDRKLFHIYMDYSWGQSHRDAVQKYLVENGPWELAGAAAIPVDEPDHSAQLDELVDSGADILHFASFGELAAYGLGMMRDVRLLDDVDLFFPVLPDFTVEALGELREHVYGFESWNPGYAAEDDAASTFVDAYRDRYGELPSQNAFYVYDCVLHYAAAVEQAGTFHPPTVIRELEGFSWDHGGGPRQYRECDHQAERPLFLTKGVDDARMDEIGFPTEIVDATDPLIYGCDEYPASFCDMDAHEYGDE